MGIKGYYLDYFLGAELVTQKKFDYLYIDCSLYWCQFQDHFRAFKLKYHVDVVKDDRANLTKVFLFWLNNCLTPLANKIILVCDNPIARKLSKWAATGLRTSTHVSIDIDAIKSAMRNELDPEINYGYLNVSCKFDIWELLISDFDTVCMYIQI